MAALAGALLAVMVPSVAADSAQIEAELGEVQAALDMAESQAAEANITITSLTPRKTSALRRLESANAHADRLVSRALRSEERLKALTNRLEAEMRAAKDQADSNRAVAAQEEKDWRAGRAFLAGTAALLCTILLATIFWRRLLVSWPVELLIDRQTNEQTVAAIAPALVLGAIGALTVGSEGDVGSLLGAVLIGIGLGLTLASTAVLLTARSLSKGSGYNFGFTRRTFEILRGAVVALLAVFALATFGSTAAADRPEPPSLDARTARLAVANFAEIDQKPIVIQAARRARRHRAHADGAKQRARRVQSSFRPLASQLSSARSALRRTETRIERLHGEETRLAGRLDEARAKEAAEAAREAELARQEQELAPPAAPAQSGCDPNYSGACVPPYPPDVNCPDVGTSVTVIGSDPHGLDGDSDGIGCE